MPRYTEPAAPASLDNPRLAVEPVPRSCWFMNARSELPDAMWRKVSRQVYAAADWKCEICQGTGTHHPVECHEVWSYEAQPTGNVQRLVRLIALCPACHEVKHFGLAQLRGRQVQALAHLAVINGWSVETAREHLQRSGAEYQERSRVRWQLDLQQLKAYGVTRLRSGDAL